MNFLYKIFLTFNATSWVIVLYGIKENWTIWKIPSVLFDIILLLIPILLSALSLLLAKKLGTDNLEQCLEIENANNSFIPTYLGYFFVGLSIDNWQHLIFVYLLIFVFTLISQTQYFNPIYLLFGYNFYYVTTKQKTKIFLITKRKIRNVVCENFAYLKRVNDTTFLELRRKNNESINSENKK